MEEGIDMTKSRTKRWRDFEEAREYVRGLKPKNSKEWREYCRSGQKPDDIPSNPQKTYAAEWQGWGDWFGTGNVANYNRVYRPFEEARAFARSLKLKGEPEWRKYCRSGEKPDDIPANPQTVYKDEWIGMSDWLGYDSRYRRGGWRPFEEARAFVRSLNLESRRAWNEYCASGQKPDDIPADPHAVYKDEWLGLGDWLGTGTVATQNRQYKSYEKARSFVRSLGLKNSKEWREYCRSGLKPDDIPAVPRSAYKGRGWIDMGDWLGTGYVHTTRREYRPFEEARAFVRSLGIKSAREWREYCTSGNKPDDIPADPRRVYGNKWKRR